MATRIGLITVGGKGERMGKINTQKCLIHLDGKPVLEWAIEALEQSGIELIFLLTGHMHEQVSSYLANRLPDRNCVVVELYGGTKGQAQAVHRLQPFLKNESFVYAPGDLVPISKTIRALIKVGEERADHIAVCSGSERKDYAPAHPGFRRIAGTDFLERFTNRADDPETHLMCTGLYYFRPGVFPFLAQVGENEHLGSFSSHALAAGEKVSLVVANEPFFYIHTPQDPFAWPGSETRKYLIPSDAE